MCGDISSRIAIYPGTFDAPTNGHIDLIRRGHTMFDRLIVAVAHNERKTPLFTVEERLEMLRATIPDLHNVECIAFEGLTVKFAEQMNARFIIRGLRAVSDFEFELQMAIMNREMAPRIETIFMAPEADFVFLSSSSVKEVWRNGGDIRPFVPTVVADAFERIAPYRLNRIGSDFPVDTP